MPDQRPRLLVTAGPTHEPIDSVRYIANRSSGRVGVEIARAALRAGWEVTLALGPTPLITRAEQVTDSIETTSGDTHDAPSRFQLIRFRTTEDLRTILTQSAANNDILIMAAAVADFRPVGDAHRVEGKMRRDPSGITLQLEATPDLVAECARRRESGANGCPDLIVAFALELASGLLEAASAKLERKGADLIVANPLETMDAESISAALVSPRGVEASTNGELSKSAFGDWLIGELGRRLDR